jgi:glycosyltransferase involved in cell wall biosynthesis
MLDVHTGAAIYTFHFLRYLAQRHEVHLVVLRGGSGSTANPDNAWSVHNLSHRAAGAKRLRQLLAVCSTRTMQEMQIDFPGCVGSLTKLVERLRPDAVFLDHIRAAWVARNWKRPNCPVVYIAHNCEAAACLSLSQMEFGYATRAALRWDAMKLRALETRILGSVDACVCLSDEDVTRFEQCSATCRFEVIPPTVVPVGLFGNPGRQRPNSLLLLGSFDWAPKRRNAIWLATRVFSRVRAQYPDATLRIVGKGARRLANDLGDRPGVELHSDVAAVLPFYEEAQIAVVPEQQASGLKLKTLEAANHGVAIVTTSSGREGTRLVDRTHCLVADDETGFASAIVELLGDGTLRQTLADAAHQRVQDHFAPDRVSSMVEQVVFHLCERNQTLCCGAEQ